MRKLFREAAPDTYTQHPRYRSHSLPSSRMENVQLRTTDMDPSRDSTVNLYPERRAKMPTNQAGRTETSPYFERSTQSDKQKRHADDASPRPTTKSGRQMQLSFTAAGQLANKQPFTNPTPRSDVHRMNLSEVAAETISLLPGLLATRPDVGKDGHLYSGKLVAPLTSADNHPNLPPTAIRVVDADTIDAALALPSTSKPPLVLNMANATHAGGGFKHGALAQEEALCYRSSLFFTLKIKYYPIPDKAAIYSPKVLVIRESMKDGHDLLDLRDPSHLPVISVVSVAAICIPELKPVQGSTPKKYTYAKTRDRELTKEKMRVVLRCAARERHTRLVLGALGCGAFRNPSWEVAEMWKAVLKEGEFQGRWDEVVFAVLGAGTDNFEVFRAALDGVRV